MNIPVYKIKESRDVKRMNLIRALKTSRKGSQVSLERIARLMLDVLSEKEFTLFIDYLRNFRRKKYET